MIAEYKYKEEILKTTKDLLLKTDPFSNRTLFLDKLLMAINKKYDLVKKILLSKGNYEHFKVTLKHVSQEEIDYFLKINQNIAFQEVFEDSYKGITQFNLFQEIKYYNFDIEEKVPYHKENEFSLTLHLSLYALIFFKTLLDKLKEDKVELHTEEILFDPDFYFDYLKKEDNQKNPLQTQDFSHQEDTQGQPTKQEEVSQVYENSQNQEEKYQDQDQEDQNTQEDQNDNTPENMPENSNYNNYNDDYNAQKQDQEEQYKDQYEDYS